MRTADDDSVPVPHDAFKLPRAVLNLKPRSERGAVWRPQRDELEPEDTDITRVDMASSVRTSARTAGEEARTAGEELDDEPTRAIQITLPPRLPERSDPLQALLARGAAHLEAARVVALKLWREGPLRSAAMVVGAVLATYLVVGGLRRSDEGSSQTVLVPVATQPATAPIIVEQLTGARPSLDTKPASFAGEPSEQQARRSTSGRARVTSSPASPAPTSRNNGYHVIAPAQLKPPSNRAERASTTVKSSSAGLPAWGAEAVREFSGAKSSAEKSVSSQSQALSAKPGSSQVEPRGAARPQDPSIPPPMGAYRSSAREQPPAAPVVAAKPVAAKPAEPPKPSKPLTMDQVLNQVEEAAQAQRKKEGLKAPKASKRDEELDALISGAMKSKSK